MKRLIRSRKIDMAGHRGWHGRGYLPHCDAPTLQMITYRLVDSLPLEVVERLLREVSDEVERRRQTDEHLDRGYGKCLLRRPEVASVVERGWCHFDSKRYDLRAWVIMPNHVHLLIDLYPNCSLSAVVGSWKSYTSKEINRVLGRSGSVWGEDYWDRFIRNGRHLAAAVTYIHENPVKARLVERAEDWRWSSARLYASLD